ncbi:MAG: PIN domain-containing protein [Nanoarchaeota archaeon]|nr:PIN domain-containing protein [Nanoarchaeota archaeon]
MIAIDTFAWVEYFLGTKKGKLVEEYLNEEDLITPSIVLIELSCKSAKENWNFQELLSFIRSKSNIVGIKEAVIEECGKIYLEQRKKKGKFGMNDAIIWTIAKNVNAKIITGDEHFKDFKEVIMI